MPANDVTQVADDYLRDLAELDPYAAQALGRTSSSLIEDLSPDAFARRHAVTARAAARLAAAEPSGFRERVLREALAERLASDVALYEAGFTTALLAPLATPVHWVRQTFDDLPGDDWDAIGRELARVPVALREYAATLTASADRGHVAARRQVLAVAAQCDGWVRDGFYPSLVTAQPALAGPAAAAAEATAGFAAFLRDDLLPRAGTRDGVGRERYEVTSAAFLGARIDVEETYAWGWSELAALTARARAVAASIVASGDVDDAVRALDADPSGVIDGVPALEAWLQQRVDETMDAVAGTHFDVPDRTRRVECRVTPSASGVMYYVPADPGLTRPGRVWWTLPDGVTRAHTWREVSTLHHEGVPGHHLQHAVTLGLDDLHPWQRSLCHVHGYAEGWAHYAEELADELGLVRTPGERLGMIFAQLWRAVRVVVDLGLHLDLPIPRGNGLVDGERWTPELGARLLVDVARVDPRTAAFEVDRYLGWPGQALAFRVGARLWRDARASSSLDPRRFHAAALGLGPVGLGPLRTLLSDLPPAP
ncbi:DUF885 domain-containing protein [Jiangella alba]|uniref:Uncharacterized conserved protein, DUF885 familyt n=1 Tax=Jiangella alba TaxID=561176 RepID=A0A1H5KBI5_9ACTN|nr:DUF885 domain-containing protein [Jiangella alba]SEE62173.1 Uncharacterized conserved protein, DUF885 familyt [Jiangella alba]